MRSDTINELIDSFRDILINRTDFNPGQVHTAATLLRTILAEPTPEEPPITRPATAESIVNQDNFCGTFEVIDKQREQKAASDKVGTGLVLIPLYSLLNLGKIFIEGLRYGRDNWKKGVNDKEYQEERLEHAILHLIKYKEGDRSEEHLAKVSWFCFTQLELERLERETK